MMKIEALPKPQYGIGERVHDPLSGRQLRHAGDVGELKTITGVKWSPQTQTFCYQLNAEPEVVVEPLLAAFQRQVAALDKQPRITEVSQPEQDPILFHSKRKESVDAIANAINACSLEGLGGNTPDYLLAELLFSTLHEFGRIVRARQRYYGDAPAAPEATADPGSVEATKQHTNLYDPLTVWYGPQPCPHCGAQVVTQAREHGERIAEAYPSLKPNEIAYPNSDLIPTHNWFWHSCMSSTRQQS